MKEEISQALELADKGEVIAVIDSRLSYEEAGAYLRAVKAMKKNLEQTRKDITRPLDDKKQEIKLIFDNPTGKLDEMARRIGGLMLEFSQKEERARIEAERKREQARMEAEQARIEALDAQDKQNLESIDNQGEVAEETERELAAKEEAARQAEAKLQSVHVMEPPKAQGTRKRKYYSAEVVDKAALVKAAAEGKEGLHYLEPSLKALNSFARLQKEAFQVAGCRLVVVEKVE